MSDDDEQTELPDGGTIVDDSEIVDANPPAHVCGAAGCHEEADLQTIRTAAGTRTLCRQCRHGWRARGGRQ